MKILWGEALLAAGAVRKCHVEQSWGYGRIRTDTDINGQVRTTDLLEYCDKPYHHKPRKRRYISTTTRLSGFQPDDRRNRQRAYFRGVIAPLMRVLQARSEGSGLASSPRAASAARRRSSKRERPVKQKKKKAGVMLSGNTTYNKPEDGPE